MNVFHSAYHSILLLLRRLDARCNSLLDQLLEFDICLICVLQIEHLENVFVDAGKYLLVLFIYYGLTHQLQSFMEITDR